MKSSNNLWQGAREIMLGLIFRVGKGEHGIHEKFIIGPTKAFPEYKLDDLFYVDSEKSQNGIKFEKCED